jgi:hypothetical protein
MKPTKSNHIILTFALLSTFTTFYVAQLSAAPLGTAFTYQGRLNDGANAANGIYDLRFTICDSATNGSVVAGPLTNAAVAISNGLFTVTLDFGSGVFDGSARWLDIGVRTNGGGAFAALTPRQALTATPYAIQAASATTAASAITAGSATTAASLSGTLPATSLTGTVPNTNLPANLARLDASQTFTGSNTFSGVARLTNAANAFKGTFTGNGGGLTSLNPASLSSGTANINISGSAISALSAASAGSAGSAAIALDAYTFLDPLAGDVTGVQEETIVERIQGIPVSTTAPATNQLLRFDGAQWVPAAVALGTDVTGTLPAAQLSGTYSSAVTLNSAGNSFTGNGSGLQNLNANNLVSGTLSDARLASNVARTNQVWLLGGNAGTTPGANFLGTTDNQALELKVNNTRVLRLEPNASGPNVIEGATNNTVTSAYGATIGGGNSNAIQSGANCSAIGGGFSNTNTGAYAAIPGGDLNVASGYSFAAGHRAKAIYSGDFVWADSTAADFTSTAINQFLIRATGGVGINTNNPSGFALNVAGNTRVSGMLQSGSVGINTNNSGGIALNVAGDTRVSGMLQSGSVGINTNNSGGFALNVAGDTRVSGMLQLGSGTGTAQWPDKALITRRLMSTDMSAGSVLARTDTATLERDGSNGGIRCSYSANPGIIMIAAMGINNTGATVNSVQTVYDPPTAGTVTVYSNAQNVVFFHCSFGNSFSIGHLTEVSLNRYPSDFYWTGTLTSTYNQ